MLPSTPPAPSARQAAAGDRRRGVARGSRGGRRGGGIRSQALRYVEGRGVAANASEGRALARARGQAGLGHGPVPAGGLYEKGIGVKKDIETARRLYKAAAEQGNAKAMHNLAVLYAEGAAVKPDYRTAAQWFRLAADHGVSDSQYNLAILYARGIGVDQNLRRILQMVRACGRPGRRAKRPKNATTSASGSTPNRSRRRKLAVQSFVPQPQPEAATTVKTAGRRLGCSLFQFDGGRTGQAEAQCARRRRQPMSLAPQSFGRGATSTLAGYSLLRLIVQASACERGTFGRPRSTARAMYLTLANDTADMRDFRLGSATTANPTRGGFGSCADGSPLVQIYLPIADIPVDMFLVLAMGLAVGFISGMFGIGGGFLMTPLLIFVGISPAVAVASVASHIAASSCSGVISYWRRRAVDLALGMMLLAGGILGTAVGVWLFTTLRALGQLDITIGVSYVVLLSRSAG